MGAVELHKTTINKIDKSRRSVFLKGKTETKGSNCQVAWDLACTDKENGGLGVQDIHSQNLCLLMKLLHKVVTRTNTPWVHWIH
ncbi:hypothetical protein PR202_ga11623 [Eleusine coracana subsp. coracana]|uniref:Uncharacterized protein n=1 Tax=Eleusine coracana subsp. coracana TaxID=191504 RepID=A0AAV5C9X9_ELECO|nr:hypothetical protein PR202_ga11623 [Eleusine coracana subsp. coracana]